MTSTQTQPSAPTRRQRRRLEIELRLLDASKRLFIAKGYDETTVAEIADRLAPLLADWDRAAAQFRASRAGYLLYS